MTPHPLDSSRWQHEHVFQHGNPAGERNTWRVVVITSVMMVVEIVAGWLFNSMALLADGWHMGTHAVALGVSGVAYVLARRWARDPRFAFGTWKIEVLAAFASAVFLSVVALYVAVESVTRLFRPLPIDYDQALLVAVLGLAVNLLCAWLLRDRHPHAGGDPAHGHLHRHRHHADLNLRSAYLHVLADALTSVLAITALLGGRFLGLRWLDPVIGIVGATVISAWAYGLIRDSSKALLDREMDHPVVERVRRLIEGDGETTISDLHVWRVGRTQYACIVSLVTHMPKTPDEYRERLRHCPELGHVSIEVNPCPRCRKQP
ncbi:MAG: CDF family Co(II)/Ni(II) efflux transporter DmeF [Pseudomonadota bacterium]